MEHVEKFGDDWPIHLRD